MATGETTAWGKGLALASHPQALRIVKWLLIVALVVQLARLIWTVATPIAPYGDWRPRGAEIMPEAQRMALFQSFDPFTRNGGAAPSTGADAVTSLDLTLYGLRINEASGGGSAIIAGGDGLQQSFSIGEEVVPGVTLAEVLFDHVVLDRGGVRESLFIDQSVPAETVGAETSPAAAQAPAGGAAAPAAGPLTEGDLTRDIVQQGVGFAPRTENGRITGLAVASKGDGRAFSAAGFRPGDVITQINGRPVSSPGDIAALVQQIGPGARISLMVERGAATVPIAIIIAE